MNVSYDKLEILLGEIQRLPFPHNVGPIATTVQNATKYLNGVVLCSVSGGSDSDIMIDILEGLRDDSAQIHYAFFDTGIEYEATKRHLDYLEERYGIVIERKNAKVPCPAACKTHGQPFLTKRASEYIKRLQKHGFEWENKPFPELHAKYPKCKAALRWWCNEFGEKSKMNIEVHRGLKEFMVDNPPDFMISPDCCEHGKKNVGKEFDKQLRPDLKILGLRNAEGGARSDSIHSCYDDTKYGKPNKWGEQKVTDPAEWRPLWFWTDKDKHAYKELRGIVYSDCYEVWGMKRTGCAGCPFGSRFEKELELIDQYEPRLSMAVRNIFGKSYEYTRMYRAFRTKFNQKG